VDHEQKQTLVTEALAASLVAEQFPQWSHLPVSLVEPGGHDNRTFRLGDELTIRLPVDDGYNAGELKEHAWLPRLAPRLPLPIPDVVAAGRPSALFARPWSVRRWIDGETAAAGRIGGPVRFAQDLAGFLRALRAIDATGGPAAGTQSFFRGADPVVYDPQTRETIAELRDELDTGRVTAVWDRALATSWTAPPVWFHGDVAAGNLIVAGGRLTAVIDFGTSGIGDPACDLAIAWTLLRDGAREAFRAAADLDDDTWDRGRGWALWKALITIAEFRVQRPAVAEEAREVLREILAGERVE
jgi:aminoglycoside phosphotransferase (APT) family kinase protein